MTKDDLRDFYQENMYGIWRDGEQVSYELLETEPEQVITGNPMIDFQNVSGGKPARISVKQNGRTASFNVHIFVPAGPGNEHKKGSPFIICMHPIEPIDYALSKGYAVIVMDTRTIASDDTNHKGAFYDLYPYTDKADEQTGVLMAWAWGASKVLDAVFGGLNIDFNLDAQASMVTGVSRWGKAVAVCAAFDGRFRMPIPVCSGAGGLALYSVNSEGKTYDFSLLAGPEKYTYTKSEPLESLQSEAERGWFNDKFLEYKKPSDIPVDQENLILMAMYKNRYYFVVGSYMGEDWVNAPAMWECYRRADEEYRKYDLWDHLAIHFHKEGHALLREDMELVIEYFERMYYGTKSGVLPDNLKSTAFAGQE